MTFMLILISMVFPFIYFLGLKPIIKQLIVAVSFGISSIFTLIVLYLPKIIIIFNEHIDLLTNTNSTNNANSMKANLSKIQSQSQSRIQSSSKTPSQSQSNSNPVSFIYNKQINSKSINNNNSMNNNNNNSMNNNSEINNYNLMTNIERYKLCSEQILQWRGLLLKLQDTADTTDSKNENEIIVINDKLLIESPINEQLFSIQEESEHEHYNDNDNEYENDNEIEVIETNELSNDVRREYDSYKYDNNNNDNMNEKNKINRITIIK